MSMIDDKLRKILDISWGGALDITTSKDFRNDKGELDEETYLKVKARIFNEAIAQIKQAFADEGYIQVPQVEIVTRWERGSKPELYMVNGKEWYERFEKELPKEVVINYDSQNNVSFNAGNNHGLRASREAAKRAAGIQ